MAAMAKKIDTSATLLAAAKKVLRKSGYSALSTRDVAAAAGVPLSQIHYHFGSKEGLLLALFEYLNDELLDRQQAMFGNPALKLSEQWDLACTYLDEDLARATCACCRSYGRQAIPIPRLPRWCVRNPALAGILTSVAREAEERLGIGSCARGRGGAGGCCLHRQRGLCSARIGVPRIPVRTALRELANSSAGLKRANPRGDVMRAKLPDTEGFIERDGVKLFYEIYGDGPETMFFPPTWSIVHSRIYKAQLPISASASAASPSMAAATASRTGRPMLPPTPSIIMSMTCLRSWTPPMRESAFSSAFPLAARSPASSRRTIRSG